MFVTLVFLNKKYIFNLLRAKNSAKIFCFVVFVFDGLWPLVVCFNLSLTQIYISDF